MQVGIRVLGGKTENRLQLNKKVGRLSQKLITVRASCNSEDQKAKK